ncbi:MAG TPA: hypothetical protein VJU84_19450 [Pyrinomonadaceae bacterium]|nr:hypothetical protein [Pyrinomonadaceae bacterium]
MKSRARGACDSGNHRQITDDEWAAAHFAGCNPVFHEGPWGLRSQSLAHPWLYAIAAHFAG